MRKSCDSHFMFYLASHHGYLYTSPFSFPMRRYLPFLSLVLLCTTMACKKDEPLSLTVTQKLTGARWQLRSAVVSTPGQPTVDGYASTPSCTQDDIIIYGPSNVWYYDEGLTKCYSTDPQRQTGTWTLSNNDTKVTITFSGTTTEYTIDELIGSTLKLSRTDTQNSIVSTLKLGYVSIP